MGTLTANYNFFLPTPGADEDVWGDPFVAPNDPAVDPSPGLNGNWEKLDTLFKATNDAITSNDTDIATNASDIATNAAAIAANATAIAANTAALIDIDVSFDPTGAASYVRLDNFLVQFGRVVGDANGFGSIVLPKTFDNIVEMGATLTVYGGDASPVI